jgi:hypothetical protein
VIAWLGAFLFTQAVEVPIYLRSGASWRAAVLASTFTHPVVWFGFFTVRDWVHSYSVTVVLMESFAILFEALWLHSRHVKRAFLWSLGANLASVTLGFASRALFGWP